MEHNGVTLGSPEIRKKLQAYVYRLVDPRTFETFYVGKGQGNRAIAHARGDRRLGKKGKDIAKLALIAEIRKAGLKPIVMIHRHGLTDAVAYEVEAALMDAYPGLSNDASGKGANRRAVTVEDFIHEHAAPVAAFTKREPCLAISINRTLAETNRSVYDCVRFAWPLSEKRAKAVKYVLAVHHGLIIDVFVPTRWKRAKDMRGFPGRLKPSTRNLLGFIGDPAPKDVQARYKGKRVPARKRGDQSAWHYLPRTW